MMGFWTIVFGIYGGGEEESIPAPNDGWIAASRVRIAIAESRERVWIAQGKTS